jgi:NAD(P)-dependent dehydrogenase (short-subunit alcohol dehydrogenase family)
MTQRTAVVVGGACGYSALGLITELPAEDFRSVNAVAPGFVHTPLTEPATHIPGVVDEYVENTPLGRAGTPEDIADAVVFLCKAPWLTGAVLDLDGGAHMMRYPDLMGHVMKLAAQ